MGWMLKISFDSKAFVLLLFARIFSVRFCSEWLLDNVIGMISVSQSRTL